MYLKDVLEQLGKLKFDVDNDKTISLAILCIRNGLYTSISSITCENAKTLFGKFIVTESNTITGPYNNTTFRFTIIPESLTLC